MVRRFRRSIYDELDELRASMDYLYQLALEPADNPLLPPEKNPEIICQYLHNLDAEVTVHDDEVTVTMDTIPGTNAKISVDLINRDMLKITCDCEGNECGDTGRNAGPERVSIALQRVVTLPGPVTNQGARLSMRNGVFDLHLKKAQT
ncbi:Hsp20/alpha crystallin family protein [Methanoregula sp.]|uniref:Hsp20/alpha crystallin family protein n=1 Tax=Methanoregula sp. TaxID=2052170 RepID=UPI0023733DA4|nr:Hsp20/alpha crystallin family protein [Methanoregula sp.]MDD1685781.1 Hsp20/alpha crystallin family protein [Methanoregula sp.]